MPHLKRDSLLIGCRGVITTSKCGLCKSISYQTPCTHSPGVSHLCGAPAFFLITLSQFCFCFISLINNNTAYSLIFFKVSSIMFQMCMRDTKSSKKTPLTSSFISFFFLLTCSAASGSRWVSSRGTVNCIFLGLPVSMAVLSVKEGDRAKKKEEEKKEEEMIHEIRIRRNKKGRMRSSLSVAEHEKK